MSQQVAIKIAIIGHSYITRLEEYSLKCESRTNLGFPVDYILVKFFSVNQGSVQPSGPHAICQVLDGPYGVNAFKPDIVFLHIGEHDVCQMDSGHLVKCYFDFCDQLASINSVRIVVVCDFLPTPVITNNAEHLECLRQCNKLLKSSSPENINVNQAYVWHLYIGAATRLFHTDGVHLNEVLGLKKYFCSIRQAISQATKSLHLQTVV